MENKFFKAIKKYVNLPRINYYYMLQRIQSLYLLGVALLSGVIALFFNLWKSENTSVINLLESKNFIQIVIALLFLSISLFAIISIFLFKKRILQKKLNWINIFLNLILLALIILNLLSLSGEFFDSMKGIGVFLPLGSIVLLVCANRAIQKDEDLVKSVDRIR